MGGAVFDVIPWPGLNTPRTTDPAVLLSQVDALVEAYKKSDDDYAKDDFFRDEKGLVYLPQHLAVAYLPYRLLHLARLERNLPQPERTVGVGVREEVLPWRPGRPSRDKPQCVFSEADMLKHPEAKTPPQRRRVGRPRKEELENRYLAVLERWDRASGSGARVSRKTFCEDNPDVKMRELMRAITWRSTRKARGLL